MVDSGKSKNPRKNILLIRLDKIGDLVCTLPVDQVLNPKEWNVTWVIQKGLGPIPTHSFPARNYFEVDKNNPLEARQLIQNWLKENNPEAAVSFNAPWWVNYELYKAKVPWRAGVRSQWHTFLFLNKAQRQKRSQSIKHEADYNLELLAGLADLPAKTPILKLQTCPIETQNVINKSPIFKQPYVVVHPGMMGSALNLPNEKWVELITRLVDETHVIITGTKSDDVYNIPILEMLQRSGISTRILETSNVSNGDFENGKLEVWDARNLFSLTGMLSVLSGAKHVYAPSTGVLHLAASLGTPSTGYFSPIRVHHPKRWGARGLNVNNLLPGAPCPAKFRCHGHTCKYFYCMDNLPVSGI